MDYKKSITLLELSNIINKYIEEHPEDKDFMVYHDGLHLNGIVCHASQTILEIL